MKKRIVSILLAVIMLLGIVPTGFIVPQAEAAEKPESIVIDFKESAKEAAKQSFWANLKELGLSKFIGRYGNKADNNMTENQIKAYDDVRDYLWDNYGWTIDEEKSYLNTTTSANKGILLNTDDNVGWGMAYLSGGFNTGTVATNGSELHLIVNVAKAGNYQIDTTAYYPNNDVTLASSVSKCTDGTFGKSSSGGAYIELLVNDTVAVEEYSYSGAGTSFARDVFE